MSLKHKKPPLTWQEVYYTPRIGEKAKLTPIQIKLDMIKDKEYQNKVAAAGLVTTIRSRARRSKRYV